MIVVYSGTVLSGLQCTVWTVKQRQPALREERRMEMCKKKHNPEMETGSTWGPACGLFLKIVYSPALEF